MKLYQTALGIETGDILTTSWNTGPYIIEHISAPKYVRQDCFGNIFVRTRATTSLWGQSNSNGQTWYVNGVNRSEQGYFSYNDPIEIIKPEKRIGFHLVDMFDSYLDSLIDEPYQFQDGVDYITVDPWHCKHCGLDFNAAPFAWNKYNTACPRCGEHTNAHVFVMSKTTLTEAVVGINHSTHNPWRTS